MNFLKTIDNQFSFTYQEKQCNKIFHQHPIENLRGRARQKNIVGNGGQQEIIVGV